jgi:signal transduction histidine kinase
MLPELKQIAEKNAKTLASTFAWVNSQTDGFNPHLEDVLIHDLFLELLSQFKDSIDLKDLSIQFIGNKDLSLCTDKFLLQFILKQIFENAIKYSNKRGVIEVIAHSESNSVNITIKDQGVGMKESIINDIGTLNNSPYTGTMQEKGAGLSLVIVKDFVELLNGRMVVASVINQGSTVTLSFHH